MIKDWNTNRSFQNKGWSLAMLPHATDQVDLLEHPIIVADDALSDSHIAQWLAEFTRWLTRLERARFIRSRRWKASKELCRASRWIYWHFVMLDSVNQGQATHVRDEFDRATSVMSRTNGRKNMMLANGRKNMMLEEFRIAITERSSAISSAIESYDEFSVASDSCMTLPAR